MLVLQESDQGTFDKRIKNNRDLGLPVTELTGDEINQKYAGVRYRKDHRGYIDHEAGILVANKCLLAFQVRKQHFYRIANLNVTQMQCNVHCHHLRLAHINMALERSPGKH